ncbi:hypothetical protein Krac_7464 [Ktedonobacter racemifer DSM 44963]|uniref:Uncharacterized protein n=1 Tax=Ktedonobacter racemifer DSM 44963 TaxID=485913 RepID=D6TK77_KTERA|nr:hypothetical protein Krac_7464 [Ktedonobacter racemifer DSM 44963]
MVSLARCQARCCSHTFREGIDGPQLSFSASWRDATPASFEAHSWGTYPKGAEAFPWRYSFGDVTLPKAVDWIPVPSHVEIAETVGNAVTFLRMALRHATRTLFSSQGTTDQFFSRTEKTEGQGLKPQTPNHGMNPRGLRRAEALFCQALP